MAAVHRGKVLILGSGPAGYTAAIYAARANLKPMLVQGIQPGGQLTITTDVENYPGFADIIQGPWLMEQMQKQAEHVGARMLSAHVSAADLSRRPFRLVCDSGDGFFYRGKHVLVIGGGNTAVEEALFLTNFASRVTLVHRRERLRAEKILQDRLFRNPKISVIWNMVLEAVIGDDNPLKVTGVVLR